MAMEYTSWPVEQPGLQKEKCSQSGSRNSRSRTCDETQSIAAA